MPKRSIRMPVLSNARTVAVSLALLGLAGCSAEQTQEAKAPDVDVDVEAGQWPKYDVQWADVDVGMRERTVTVPVVRVEQETREVSVPYLDINPPAGGDREERTVAIEVDVPHAGHQLQIVEVRAAGDALWVIGQLTETDGDASQVATRVSDQVIVNAPEDLNIRKVVVGERPDGSYNQQFRFVDSMGALEPHIPEGGRVLYRRDSSAS